MFGEVLNHGNKHLPGRIGVLELYVTTPRFKIAQRLPLLVFEPESNFGKAVDRLGLLLLREPALPHHEPTLGGRLGIWFGFSDLLEDGLGFIQFVLILQ